MKTFQYKLKLTQGQKSRLKRLAGKVNFVWNYCNATNWESWTKFHKTLNWVELGRLTKCSKELQLQAQSIAAVCQQYDTSRRQHKKLQLRYRTAKKNLGWIPIQNQSIKQLKSGKFNFMGYTYKFFENRPMEGRLIKASINQDSCDDWYVNFTCEVPEPKHVHSLQSVGVDLGLKDLATTSDGEVFSNPKYFTKGQKKLATAQKYQSRKKINRVYRKQARCRQDHLNKVSSVITKTYKNVYVGNLNLGNSKSTLDTSYRGLISLMETKAIRLGGTVTRVNEAFTTVTCSKCLERSGPNGLKDLSVREWTCVGCGQMHSRDVNSAINILRLGLQVPSGASYGKPLTTDSNSLKMDLV